MYKRQGYSFRIASKVPANIGYPIAKIGLLSNFGKTKKAMHENQQNKYSININNFNIDVNGELKTYEPTYNVVSLNCTKKEHRIIIK